MNKPNIDLPTINRIKQRAKKLKSELNISHSEALKNISAEYGFSSWNLFQDELKKHEQAKAPTPTPSLTLLNLKMWK